MRAASPAARKDEVIQIGAAQAERPWPFHDQQVPGLAARGARPVAEGGDDDQVGSGALAPGEPALLGLGQLRGDPMGPVGRLEGRVAAAGEPQLPPVPGPGHVRGPLGSRRRSAAQRRKTAMELVEVDLSQARQVVGPTLTPGIDGLRGQPAEADQHADSFEPIGAALCQLLTSDVDPSGRRSGRRSGPSRRAGACALALTCMFVVAGAGFEPATFGL